MLYTKRTTGQFPSAFQANAVLYRRGNYVMQNQANANPDNFFDRRFFCWTTDPYCGLDIGPKRPQEDLKDPRRNLIKFHRDPTENVRLKVSGYTPI